MDDSRDRSAAAATGALSALSGVASSLPSFSVGALPEPESSHRKRLIRAASIIAILATVAYLTWRVWFTVDLSFWWVAVPLIVLEFHNALGLGMFTVALWDVDRRPSSRRVEATDEKVAVLIPTYNEPEEVLLPTVASAIALEPAHETWVLDDGRRPEVAKLAEELGARYLARETNEHAKAGNINNALRVIDADIVAVLDADHVALPDFLRNTLGYFDDPELALVQTPQDFYNADSFEHEDCRGGLYNEQAVFYRVIAAGKNYWGGAFWCGTCALVRTAALREVGGVATESVTEDIHTTIRMHRRGWKTTYHNEVLARGLAARGLDEYLIQRNRWATGAMQVLRVENPVVVRGLSFGQRLSYATTLWAWFDAWRSLAYIVLPIAVLATGAIPISAPIAVFGPVFLGVLALQFVTLRLLARGHYPPILSILFEFLRMPAVIPGTLALCRRRPARFNVTPKGRSGDEWARASVPRLIKALLAGSALALVWSALVLSGVLPFTYEHRGVVVGAGLFLIANASFLVIAARRIRSSRYGTERRGGARLPLLLAGRVDDVPCDVHDLSLAGAGVELDISGKAIPDAVRFQVAIGSTRVTSANLPAPKLG
ncbi:MAG: glycosyltransferase, partial [Gaiellales bacterium]